MKNILFCGNHSAAEDTAVIYTFMGCCKLAEVDFRKWTNVFDKPRAEAKLALIMPRRENVCCKTNVFDKPRAEAKLAWIMPRRENVCCKTNVFSLYFIIS